MFKNILLFVSIVFLLSGCWESEEAETPAQKQIDEYTQKLEECKDGAEQKKGEIKKEEPTAKPHVRGHDIELDDMVLGNKKSKIILVEYFSPTCPHCATYHKKIFPDVKKKYIDTGKIAYVFREFIGNKQDLNASILARCKNNINNYKNFIEVLLEQQDNWAFNKNYNDILVNIATLGGVSDEQYSKCLEDEGLNQVLFENSRLLSKEPNFVGTPAFFINGSQFTDPYTFEELAKAIDAAIDNAK